MDDGSPVILRQTPLRGLHVGLGGKMVPFAGYEMPVQFRGILAEHLHARAKAALFDVSHMGQITVAGDGAARALERLVVGEIEGMATGRMRYTLLTNERGGIVDDLMLIHNGASLTLIVNASRKDLDLEHLRRGLAADGLVPELRDDLALVALQGPAAAGVLARLAPAAKLMLFMTCETLKIGDIRCSVCRSGYTGEDGFEISVPATRAEELCRMLLAEPEVAPAGLGARDTLRLEAGLCLYGNDIDETTTPVEAGLAWTIGKRRRRDAGFPGAGTILVQLRDGPPRRRVGIELDGRSAARAGSRILDRHGADVGVVTSGSFAPSLGRPIAMGYVRPDCAPPETTLGLMIRDKPVPGRVVAMPFVEHRYVR